MSPLWFAAGLAAGLVLGGLIVRALMRRREKRRLARLTAMLDAAIAGDFRESDFTESMESAIESRLAQYLAANAKASGALAQERDKLHRWIGDIAHQTRTPIANLLLYAELLCERLQTPQGAPSADPDEPLRLARRLQTQAEKLQWLMEALLKLSRLETGVLAVRPAAGPVWPAVVKALDGVRPAAAAKNLRLTAEPSPAQAVLDPKWTAEAVGNLLDNAVKYTPPGGTVSVRVTAYELFCRIDVADTGPGVPEEEQPRIFGRFYRAPNAREAEGVGIGLYLTRQIAAAQGGYLKLRSTPGAGSTFSLFLPRPQGAPEKSPANLTPAKDLPPKETGG